MPVVLFYDLVPAGIAIAWILIDARRTGFYPWEKFILAILFISPVLILAIGIRFHVPVGPLYTLTLLGLSLRRSGVSFRPSWLPASSALG